MERRDARWMRVKRVMVPSVGLTLTPKSSQTPDK
jgi:hypothetical protein